MAISERVKRLLWARSGGFCQNPSCQKDFFVFFADGTITSIEELAHIIAKSNKGPRSEEKIDTKLKDEYENIILLCPNCHTLIDKNQDRYPFETLKEWKKKHEQRIKDLFELPIYQDRKSLGRDIHKILLENKLIFQTYGPDSEHSNSLLTDAQKVWIRYIHSKILPNNRKIVQLLSRNIHLLTEEEKLIFEKFKIHQEAFEYNHISGDKNSSAPLFPPEMEGILKEE